MRLNRIGPNRCIGCGGPADADCVDNFGAPYKGCSRGCRILSLTEIKRRGHQVSTEQEPK